MEVLKLRIGRLRLKPGDVVVLQCGLELREQTQQRLYNVVGRMLPPGVKHILIGPNWKLSVITAEAAEKLAESGP